MYSSIYTHKNLPIANLKDGLYSENERFYEEIGYNKRTLEYLEYSCFLINIYRSVAEGKKDKHMTEHLVNVINTKQYLIHSLFDTHSISIVNILK